MSASHTARIFWLESFTVIPPQGLYGCGLQIPLSTGTVSEFNPDTVP